MSDPAHVETEDLSPVLSTMFAAITELIHLRGQFEQYDESKWPEDETVRERALVYCRLMDELADGNHIEAIDELVSFATSALQIWAKAANADAQRYLQSLTLNWRPEPYNGIRF